ncbi:unnamed protein product [Mytilus edulis]|uniref:DZIP3-like HEPN domain-containing protein n=1 Tax=Mytilus edulis TaxID=6550 RepID=A0A8S3V0Q9_MYTED|nr:unnamed protein product [Mytilus edulis]
MNLCSLRKNVDELTDIRNMVYGHALEVSISDQEYETKWQQAKACILSLSRECSRGIEKDILQHLEQTSDQMVSNQTSIDRTLDSLNEKLDRVLETSRKLPVHTSSQCILFKEDIGRLKFLVLLGNDYGTTKSRFELNNCDNGSEVFHIRLFSLVLLAVLLFFYLCYSINCLGLSTKKRFKKKIGLKSNALLECCYIEMEIYFAAAGQNNNVNIYDVTTSPYEEIDDVDLVPEHLNDLIHRSVVNDADNYQEEDVTGVRQYLELE